MKRDILDAILAARRDRRALIVLRDPATEDDRLIYATEDVPPEDVVIRDAVRGAFATGRSATLEVDGRSWFLETHVPAVRLVIIGAVHISQALAPMARQIGLDVMIIDPRTAFATPERFPGENIHADWPEEVLGAHPLDAYTAVAAVTHDPKIDDPALDQALKAGCVYIGALGSRKTHARRVERLSALGHTENAIRRIHAPIGLDIGAASPAEIAVAALAEIIDAIRRPAGSP